MHLFIVRRLRNAFASIKGSELRGVKEFHWAVHLRENKV